MESPIQICKICCNLKNVFLVSSAILPACPVGEGHLLPTWRQWPKWLRHGVALNVTGGEFLVMSRFDHGHGVSSL